MKNQNIKLTKFQRGLSVAFAVACLLGLTYVVSSVFTNASASYETLNDRKTQYLNDGYSVIYDFTEQGSSQFNQGVFDNCQDPSKFLVLDKKWNQSSSSMANFILCELK